jgi:hypothetical protein
MVLHVLADTRKFLNDLDPVRGQHIAAANARQFQQLRRLHRAGRKDNLPGRRHRHKPTFAPALDADRSPVLDQDARDLCVGPDFQVAAVQDRPEI